MHATVSTFGDDPQKLCVGHSDKLLLDSVYKTVVEAKEYVDIATLNKVNDKFLPALKNAFSYIDSRSNHHSTQNPIVRIFLGVSPDGDALSKGACNSKATNLYTKLIGSDSGFHNSDRFSIAAVRFGTTSWTHSKLIAVDGNILITGGHNLWGDDYLGRQPIFDVSMKLNGSIAEQAHYYANTLWNKISTINLDSSSSAACYEVAPKSMSNAVNISSYSSQSHRTSSPDTGDTAVLATADLSELGYAGLGQAQNSTDSIKYMIEEADSSLYISQQALFNNNSNANLKAAINTARDSDYWSSLISALGRDVEMHIFLSAKDTLHPGYNTGLTLSETFRKVYNKLMATGAADNYFNSHSDFVEKLCEKATLYNVRYSMGSDNYQGQDTTSSSVTNHAKTLMADDRYFIIGSNNMYPHGLGEFSVLVDDETAAAEYKSKYWDKLTHNSKHTCYGGSECPTVTASQCVDDLPIRSFH